MSDHENCAEALNCTTSDTEATNQDATCNTATISNETTPDETTPEGTQESTISDRKRRANRENARKSTGPRTEDGKAKSRRNALKHGLSGDGTVLPPEDLALFQERLQGWSNEDHPDGELESYLLACAVLASVRVDRCAKLDFADVAVRRKATTRNWERRQARRAQTAAAGMDDDPAHALERLSSNATGCNWLIFEWQELRSAVQSEEGPDSGWNQVRATQALRLLGRDPELVDDEPARTLRRNVLALSGEIDPDEADTICGVSTAHLEPDAREEAIDAILPDAESAREALLAMIDAEIGRLEARRNELWTSQDGPKLASEIALTSFDPSDVGNRRRRYEATSLLDMHRNLNLITRRRDQARRQELRDAADGRTPSTWKEPPASSARSPVGAQWHDPDESYAEYAARREHEQTPPPAKHEATAEPSIEAFAPVQESAPHEIKETSAVEEQPRAPAESSVRNEPTEVTSTVDQSSTSVNDTHVTKPVPTGESERPSEAQLSACSPKPRPGPFPVPDWVKEHLDFESYWPAAEAQKE
jgi:hypothetical protein